MATVTIIGGNGYRWRGRSIRTVHRGNVTCVTMPRRDSMIMSPCSVIKGKQYRVIITASRIGGNGFLLVNFFGGQNYDGIPASMNISSSEMCDYTVYVNVPEFPKSIPMNLRIWRSNKAIGNIYIRTIRFELILGKLNIPKTPVVSVTPIKKSIINENKPSPSRKKRIRDKKKKLLMPSRSPRLPMVDKIMKFKPYKIRNSTDSVFKVLVQKPEDVPKVSIITPTRDGIELIKKCYEALNKNTSYPNWEWIIGDSESTDGTIKCIKSWNDPRIKLIERGTIDGSFSSINNELALFATGEYLLFLNNDTQPQPFWLYEMMSKIHGYPKIGVIGARLMYNENKIQHVGIAFISQGPANIGNAVLKSFSKDFYKHDRFYQAVTGACFLMRSKDFKAVGGFDPIYYFCYEDVDLCLKIKDRLNKQTLYVANAVIYHAEGVTQKKYKTSSPKQQVGINEFKKRWMNKVEIDFTKLQHNVKKGIHKIDISFVTCVNNISQYRNCVVGSLFKSKTNKTYEIIPVLNFDNSYSAAGALNIGIKRARADIIVLCHQDVLFYEMWIDMLFDRIKEVKLKQKNWGVLGTAGISTKDATVGVVYNMKGRLQWQSTVSSRVYPVQTVDEHCMIIRKSSGLRFDSKTFNGFHCYGPDICLSALSKGLINFGILCPLVHNSVSGSLVSGKADFMKNLNALAKKWRSRFPLIRTPTSVIRKKSIQTFINFKN